MDALWFYLTLTLDIIPFISLSIYLLRKSLPCRLSIAYLKIILPLMLYNLLVCATYMNGLYGATVMVGVRVFGMFVAWGLLVLTFKRFYLPFLYKCLVSLAYLLGILVLSAFIMSFIDTSNLPDFMAITCLRFSLYIALGHPYYLLEKKLLISNFDIDDKRSWIGFILSQCILNTAMLLTVRTDYASNGIDLRAFILQTVMVLASMSITVFLSYIFRLTLDVRLTKEKQEKEELILGLNMKQNDVIQENIEQMKHLRHDIKHHARVIERLLSEGKIEEAREYLNEYTERMPTGDKIKFCNRLSMNALLEYYSLLCIEKGIQYSFSFAELSDSTIDEVDLNILLGNAIENAIEATLHLDKEHRAIQATAMRRAGNLFITVDNPFDGILRNQGEALLSAKRKYQKPGYGNASMEVVVKKYNGQLKRTVEGQSYQLSIVLEEK